MINLIHKLGIQSLLQDGFDRPVARVAIVERALASGVQARCAIRFGRADDALALPQEMEVVLSKSSLTAACTCVPNSAAC